MLSVSSQQSVFFACQKLGLSIKIHHAMIYLIFKVMNVAWCFPSKQSKQSFKLFKLFFTFSSKLFVLPVLVSQVSRVIFDERFEAILVFENFCPICTPKMNRNGKNVSLCPNNGCLISVHLWHVASQHLRDLLPGAQPEIFQGRGGFVK